jgi:hypothetical protein
MIACVVGEQFQRAKRCDRFYYENDDPNVRFTPGEHSQPYKERKTSILQFYSSKKIFHTFRSVDGNSKEFVQQNDMSK